VPTLSKPSRCTLVILMAPVVAACGGDAGGAAGARMDTPSPMGGCVNIAGTWRLAEAFDFTACGEGKDLEHSNWTIDQTGCALTIREGSHTWSATISGNSFGFTRTFTNGDVTTTLTGSDIRVVGDTFSGRESAHSMGGGKVCDGFVDITGTRATSALDAGPTGTGGQPGTQPEQRRPNSVAALAVGAWATVGTTCASGSTSEFAYFLCPGGRIRGAGKVGAPTELICGTYITSPPTYSGCSDKLGCFPTVDAKYTSTLILSGQQDVQYNTPLTLFLTDDDHMVRGVTCRDNSRGQLTLERVTGTVTDDYCVSAACPAPSGSSGGRYGQCGTDCDCGKCWYCESGQCRFGGEGPSGCYRGCGP
jgi:hypothetical protein